jgi:GDPmannose 4,6-dehydratase
MKEIKKQKIAIVTGVTGQMGSYFADKLVADGLLVIGTVRRTSAINDCNIKHIVSENFKIEPMDLSDSHSISNIVEKYKPDYFINCAANSFVGTSWDFPEQHLECNGLGVLRQLEAIRRLSPHTRYVNFGSSEEFGDVLYSPQDEEHPARARSPYGASKIYARQIVKTYRESYGLFAIQSWSFNYESERRGYEFVTRKITQNVARIKKGFDSGFYDELPLELGNLNSKRDWSHALDVVDGVWLMLNNKEPKEYILASNETHSVREFVELAFKAAGINGLWYNFSSDPQHEEFILAEENGLPTKKKIILAKINPKFYRPCEVELLWGNSEKARKELGWLPKISFQELVERMVYNDIDKSS